MKKENKKVEVAHPSRQRYFGAAHAHSVVHFALNFPSVLSLKAIVRSHRIFSLSKTLEILKLGEVLFNHERNMIFCNNTIMIEGLKNI